MADKPIIFSAPMARALLDGRKTQTRRVLKPWRGMQAAWLTSELLQKSPSCYLATVDGHFGAQMQHPLAGTTQSYGRVDEMSPLTWVRLPYAPGDRLYVREQWSGPYSWRDMKPSDRSATGSPQATEVWYWADGSPDSGDWEKPRPSIHMPRWASRLTLTVTDVRVQRLQDISEADSFEEGCNYRSADGDLCHWGDHPSYSKMHFQDIWNSLHGPDAWDANPWVCALTFTVQRENIGQAL